jgi:threonine dehydratase
VTRPLVTLDQVRAAHELIRDRVLRTPLVAMSGAGVLLKAESLQSSGSFKLRGALHSILLLDEAERRRGVVAHSSGNHAVAVAMAGRLLGVPVTVVVPDDAPAVKVDRTRAAGAEVVVVGPASAERAARAAELAHERGLAPVEPYDSDAVIAATGTISVEILEDVASASASPSPSPLGGADPLELYVPVSGGGLIAGVAAAAKALDPTVRLIGVEPEVAADALASRRAGHQVTLPAERMAATMADGLRVQRVGDRPWPHLQAFVDEIVTVSEDEIAAAVAAVADQARLVAEPSGAVPVAAALAGRGSLVLRPDRRVAVLTGGNVDPGLYRRLLATGA